MKIKNIFTIFLIIINFVLIVLIINRISKENFDIFKFASDSIVNLNNLKLRESKPAMKCDETEDPSCAFLPRTSADVLPDDCTNPATPGIKKLCPKTCAKLNKNLCKAINLNNNSNQPNIYVGGKEDLPINSNVNIGTNNTIFIKEHSGYTGIKIEPAAKSYHYPPDQYELNIKSLKEMKYLPYNFKDKICIGNSCIDKVNLKILKGNVGFTLNTYTAPQPFRMFTDINFLGWSKNYGTDYVNDITSSNFVSIKSFKISDSNYMITAYELPNYGGTKTEFTSSEMSDVTSIFPNGFKSFQPSSSKGNLLKNSCLSLQTVTHEPTGNNKMIQAIPCDLATDTYYIARDDITNNHTHAVDAVDDDIHFHEHNKSETYHFESSGG